MNQPATNLARVIPLRPAPPFVDRVRDVVRALGLPAQCASVADALAWLGGTP